MREARLYTHGHASIFSDLPRSFDHGEYSDSRIQNAVTDIGSPHLILLVERGLLPGVVIFEPITMRADTRRFATNTRGHVSWCIWMAGRNWLYWARSERVPEPFLLVQFISAFFVKQITHEVGAVRTEQYHYFL
jgi:hypothetical protein